MSLTKPSSKLGQSEGCNEGWNESFGEVKVTISKDVAIQEIRLAYEGCRTANKLKRAAERARNELEERVTLYHLDELIGAKTNEVRRLLLLGYLAKEPSYQEIKEELATTSGDAEDWLLRVYEVRVLAEADLLGEVSQ